jgi:hypothetical protein
MKSSKHAELEKYNDLLSGLKKSLVNCQLDPGEPHPDSLLLALYASGDLDRDQEKHVKAHVIHCDRCYEDVSALRALDEPVHAEQLVFSIKKKTLEILEHTGELIDRGTEFIVSTAYAPPPGPAFAAAGVRLMGPAEKSADKREPSAKRVKVKTDYAVMRYTFTDGGFFDIRILSTGGQVSLKSAAYSLDTRGRKRLKTDLYAYLVTKQGRKIAAGPVMTDGKASLIVKRAGNYFVELRKKDSSLAGVVDLKIS